MLKELIAMKNYLLYTVSLGLLTATSGVPAYAGGGGSKMLVSEITEALITKTQRFPKSNYRYNYRHYSTQAPRKFYNPARDLYHYYTEPQPLELVKPGRQITKKEIEKNTVPQREKVTKEEDKSQLSSYKMPEYKKKD